ncbi:MAG: hypothetical protein GXP14_07490 [Gammaproteobacteria bacterium]|nr:hypothetical protein [Gammaproteobacteria bacterium]
MKNNNQKKNEINANKNIRSPIGAETSHHKMSKAEEIRIATGKQKRIDWDHYTRLPEYEGMRLFGCNDEDGELNSWFQLGAEPVKRQGKSRKTFAGINDTSASEYEYVEVGVNQYGNPIKCYLLFIPEKRYLELKIEPQNARNQAIRDSMGMGVMNNDGQGKIMPNIKGLQTYAPNTSVNGEKVGSGHRGLSTEMKHDA